MGLQPTYARVREEAMAEIPKHWAKISWEEKARENPLYAVMTTGDVAEAGAENFDPKHLEAFFAKGERLYEKNIEPLLERSPDPKETSLVAEYGCGMGRLLAPLLRDGYRAIGV